MRHNQDGSFEVVIPSDPLEARRVQDLIEAQLKSLDYEDREIFGIKLALEEALVNAIKHGNQLDGSKHVFIDYRLSCDRFEIGIRDEGRGFDPEDVPDPQDVENLERPCGRGLLLMRHYMTDVRFHPPGNRLTMSKIRNGYHHLNGSAKK
jgi:serine/threonine-protein kinase RsbW